MDFWSRGTSMKLQVIRPDSSCTYSTFLTCCHIRILNPVNLLSWCEIIFSPLVQIEEYPIRGYVKVPAKSAAQFWRARTLYRDYTSRKRCDSGWGGGGEGKNFISRGAVSRNSLHKTVGDIRETVRAATWNEVIRIKNTRPRAARRNWWTSRAHTHTHTTCNYNYKSLGERDGYTRSGGGLCASPATSRRHRNLFAEGQLGIWICSVVFMRRYMQWRKGRRKGGERRNETRRFRWKLVFLSRFFFLWRRELLAAMNYV